MSGHPAHAYYGADHRSQRQPAGRNPYRASTGNAAALYGAYGAGAGASAAPVPSHYRGDSDDWSSTYYGDDSFTDDSVSEDFQRISLADSRRHHPHHPQQQQPPPQQQQHPQQARYSYAANVAAGRNGGAPPSHRGHAHSQRAPSPTDSSYSQTTASASTYATHRQHAQTAAAFHANHRVPSKSLDRLSHYLGRGYRLAGPYGGEDDENTDPRFGEDDRSRGVMVPARSVPRTKSLRRVSPPDTSERGREDFARRPQHQQHQQQQQQQHERRGPQYYSHSEKAAAYKRSRSQDRTAQDHIAALQERERAERVEQERVAMMKHKMAHDRAMQEKHERLMQERLVQEKERAIQEKHERAIQEKLRERMIPDVQQRRGRRDSRPPPGELVLRSSSIGRFDTLSQGDKTDIPTPNMGALVRRSKSVGPREAYRRRRSLGPVTRIERFDDSGPSTALRLDLGGGQDVEVSVNNRDRRRGPTIGSITINQHRGHKSRERERERGRDGDSGERLLGAPSDSIRTITTGAFTEKEREYEEKMRRFRADISDSPPTSPELDMDEFSRMDRKFGMGQRQRSASVGTALPRLRTKIPLQITAPPSAGGAAPVPQTPGGGEPRHTRISRKIVTRQALEELGYRYEDTGDTFTVYEILQPPQIDELIEITAGIRAARHDRRRARSRGERQFAEFGVDEYGSRKGPAPGPQKQLRPVITQEQKPFQFREPQPNGPPMPGAWPQQPPERRNNIPMPDHKQFMRPGPGNLGGPPQPQPQPVQQPAGSRFGRKDGVPYYR
ncbi:hypothetical protein TWF481_006913 [Arthrobotrys musiformis]|uniref:DUF8035 domain-containing protein n=1 Tax=Arthrobotrys musiformis TaxID=47236 RepID=A0AAV9WAW4_9PEZI